MWLFGHWAGSNRGKKIYILSDSVPNPKSELMHIRSQPDPTYGTRKLCRLRGKIIKLEYGQKKSETFYGWNVSRTAAVASQSRRWTMPLVVRGSEARVLRSEKGGPNQLTPETSGNRSLGCDREWFML